MLQKLHKTKESEDLAEAEKSFCQQMMSLHDYGYFFYTGRQSKKQDSEPVLFAVHATGVYFFEISKNVFKPAKQVQFYAWKNIKENIGEVFPHVIYNTSTFGLKCAPIPHI